jgi:acyl transferase domain-containing protein/acyl-CoA synthetase (AMP-forming)/AMP-acid ligase II/acyl carrier protein
MLHAELIRPVHELLANNAARFGSKVAFSDIRGSVSYVQLRDRTNRLAGHLMDMGVGRGDRVAVLLGNRTEIIECYVGVVRAGAVVVPLNPEASDSEVRHFLDDSGAIVVITDSVHVRQVGRLSWPVDRMVVVADDPETGDTSGSPSYAAWMATAPDSRPPDDLGLDDPAYMLYTSGTTGPAKGVVSTQRSCMWSVAACYAPILGLSENDRVLWPAPLFHSLAHILCVLGVTAVGGTAHIASGFSAQAVVEALRDEPFTFLVGVPTMYHYLTEEARRGGARAPALRMCLVAGAPCPAALRREFEELFDVALLDGYGSTETCGLMTVNWSTGTRIDGSCGLPVPGMALRVVDPDTGTDRAAGVEGEVWVRGPNLMLGYHNQPEATATALAGGWYRTGDLARCDELGFLTITGRIKELIIRSGENISPREIEEVAQQVPGVAEAAVVGKPDDALGEVPVVFVVAREEGFDPRELLARCRAELSPVKVPVEVHETDSIPRTASGKIIRHALLDWPARRCDTGDAEPPAQPVPAPAAGRVDDLAGVLAAMPVTDHLGYLTGRVCAAVTEVRDPAQADDVDPTASFREAGLTSLTAVRLSRRLSELTGRELPSTVAFDYPSPEALARFLRTELVGAAAPATATPVPAETGEPIAIVSMACRYPGGVTSPESLWQLLADGGEVQGDFPTDRGWDLGALFDPDPDKPGTSYVRRGGFVDDVAGFDAELFGISPREALAMDPQQRLLLESIWELLERAGISAESLRGSDTGVFVGAMHQDYATGVTDDVDGHALAGTADSVISGRVSYAFGFEGPALTVDTACSSSLVALHLAVRALRSRECSLGVVGGVTVMATPTTFVRFSRQRALAPDGRCKAFAGAADGTGWSEGVGVLLVERLSDARRLGHRVLGVVRGSAINQDGASNGLTAPSGPAQQRVIRQALASAGLTGVDVDAVEAHGTGTRLGDPIEAQALIATYGQDRSRERPLWLGSVKSNLGHTQAAAGVAGVIKMLMAMRHGVLPRTLHVDQPAPLVDWSAGAVALVTEARPWPEADRVRRAGVSAFGVSGTNAHVVLEEPPEPPAPRPVTSQRPLSSAVPWVLSAATPAALRAQATRLSQVAGDPADVASSLATGRTVLAHRAVVVGADGDQLRDGLTALAQDREHPRVITGHATAPATGVVLVFPGHGSQWAGMAASLLDESPVFADWIDRCEQALAPHVDWSLREVLRQGPAAPSVDRVDVVQPVLFAVTVSLAQLWRACGIRPGAVVGHSLGEIAAACVAGALTLDDAAALIANRGRVVLPLAGRGGMVSLWCSRTDAAGVIAPWGARLAVATANGPTATTVSGDTAAIEELLAHCDEIGVRARRVAVDYATHSAQVESVRERFVESAAGIQPRTSEIPLYSSVTGDWIDGASLNAEYWYRNLREPVEFEHGVRGLLDAGHRVFVEASPHPVLTTAIQDTAAAAGARAVVLGTLRRDHGGADQFLTALATAHVSGVHPDWTTVTGRAGHVGLPTYPFQRQRFWLDAGSGGAGSTAAGLAPTGHPLLPSSMELPGLGVVLTGRLSLAAHPWLADHRVFGRAVVPATALVEMAVRAGDEVGHGTVAELVVQEPLVVPDDGAVQVRVVVADPDGDRRTVTVHSTVDGGAWTRNAAGTLVAAAVPTRPAEEQWPPAGARPLDVAEFYPAAAGIGLTYGPAFRGVRAAWRRDAEVFAEVHLPEDAGEAGPYGVHPALLDAALHASGMGGLTGRGDTPDLPFAWNQVCLHTSGASSLRVRVAAAGDGAISLDCADSAGTPVLSAASLALRPADAGQLASARDALFAVQWVPAAPDTAAAEPTLVWETPTGADTVESPVCEALSVVQDWLATDRPPASRLVIVTRGAVAADGAVDVAGAGVWGLVRSAQVEHPDRVVLLDLPAELASSDPVVGRAVATGQAQLAVRGGQLLVPRLTRVAVPEKTGPELGSGVVVITGGSGALGGVVARHLVTRHGARRLLLLSRRGTEAPCSAELAELGATVDTVACDVADRDALAAALDGVPVIGVVHAAGVLDDGVVPALTPRRVRDVWSSKVDGARNLSELTGDRDLAFFVVFSSIAGVLGGAGQANYAAANAAMDAVVTARRAAGLPGVSIAWGLWAESGLTGSMSAVDLDRMSRSGIVALTAEEGSALFDAALANDAAQVVAARLDLSRTSAVLPMLRGLAPTTRRAAARNRPVAEKLAGLSGPDRERAILELVGRHAAITSGRGPTDRLSPEQTFKELGFDSLTAVELRNRLAAATGVPLPATLVFDHPTLAELAEHLTARLDQVRTGHTPAGQGSIVSLFRRLTETDRHAEAFALLANASAALPTFTAEDGPARALSPLRLATGRSLPTLVCFPSVIAIAGPAEYLRFGESFVDDGEVVAVRSPGYLPDELVPRNLAALVRMHVHTVLSEVGDEPFVLLGRSMGGVVAHAVTAALEERGVQPEGLVLVDTHPLTADSWLRALVGRTIASAEVDEAALLGMGAHQRVLADWTPTPVRTPTLQVRARDRAEGVDTEDWRPSWPLPHTALDVPGDHFSVLEEHSASTAQAIRQWIESIA